MKKLILLLFAVVGAVQAQQQQLIEASAAQAAAGTAGAPYYISPRRMSAGGGGNVHTTGTPTNGQFAQWTDATHVQGITPGTGFTSAFAAAVNTAGGFTVLDGSGNLTLLGSLTTGSGGSVAGNVALGQGTTPSAGTTNITLTAPTVVTSYIRILPGTAASGFYYGTNLAGTVTDSQIDSTGSGSVVLSDSPIFTGVPTAPTATAGTNTQQLATTAFVLANTTPALSINAQTGTTYTLAIGDANNMVSMSNAAANTLTVPPNSSVPFAVGTQVVVAQLGAGATSISAGVGVTINAPYGLGISAQYGIVTLVKTGTDTWQLASGPSVTTASGKLLTVNNTLTLAGTDGTTMTFPSTSATIARTDAANTFTGHQTIEGVTSTGATGTGKFVFDTSPTLVTPLLGTPTSGTLTNCTTATASASTRSTALASTAFVLPTVNAQTGTTYTLAATDANNITTLSNASAITLTIPANATTAYVDGDQFPIMQKGAGTVTIHPASGSVTINGVSSDYTMGGQYAWVTLVKIGTGTDTWALSGANTGYATSAIASGSAISLTTNTAANVTSISLPTVGTWYVTGNVNFALSSATQTAASAGINTTSATVPTDGTEVYSGIQLTTTSTTDSVTIPSVRIVVTSAPQTVYLVAKSTFSAGTETAFGSISARQSP